MTQRTHAVAKTRAHQVRWSSRCRSRARGSGRDASGAATATAPSSAPGAPAAVARGRGNEAKLLLPSSSSAPVVGALRTRHRGSHALLRPQKSKLDTTPTFKRVSSSKPPAFLNPAALSACGLPSLAAPFLPRSIPVPSPFLHRSHITRDARPLTMQLQWPPFRYLFPSAFFPLIGAASASPNYAALGQLSGRDYFMPDGSLARLKLRLSYA
jgi:hypothetical protein